MPFQQKKFLSLSLASQHKKIAERIKRLYHDPNPYRLAEVQQLQKWMGLKPLLNLEPQELSHNFHHHQAQTGLGLSEHDLLVKTHDLSEPKEDWLDLVIYLDHLRSAHNIGNILRTVEAFRLGEVCFAKGMPTLTHPAVQKTAMGSTSHIKEFGGSFEDLPKPLIAVETHKRAVPLQDFVFPDRFTIAIGNEEYGLSKEVLNQADQIIEIPLFGLKNSLNVAACFSILAWKISQSQRKHLNNRIGQIT